MMKKSFTTRKAFKFGLLFQFYFIGTSFLVWIVRPEATFNRYLTVFMITQTILGFLLWNWKQQSKSEVHDEREANIRLQVRSFTARVTEFSLAATIIASVTIYKDMSTLFGLLSVAFVAVIAEAYANYILRRG